MNHNFIAKQLLRKQNEIWDEFDSAHPPELFHYTCPKCFHSIIESGEIWLTDIANVNDPREGDYGLQVIQSVLARNRTRVDEEFAKSIMSYKSLFGLNESWSLYVACFCSAGERAQMWKNYACAGTGYAIAFDYDKLIAGALAGKKYSLFRVLYDRVIQEQKIEATLEHAFALELTMNLPAKDHQLFWMKELAVALIACASRFKAPKWSYEEEFRLSIVDPPDILKFDSEGKSRIRIDLARDTVKSVIRGSRSGANLDVLAMRALLNQQGYGTDVQVVEARTATGP